MIGVLDSGSGGLTVLAGLQKAMPDQKFIYYGDHKNSPYGDKTRRVVQAMTEDSVEVLFKKGCKLVIVACNTMCAVALKRIQREWLPTHHPDKRVLGIVVPTVETVTGQPWRDYKSTTNMGGSERLVAVFGTLRTIASQVYPFEIHKRRSTMRVVQQAIVGLANAIDFQEPDHVHRDLIADAYETVLEITDGEKPSSVLLGCTHYPLVAHHFQDVMGEGVEVLDQSRIVADALMAYIKRHPQFVEVGDSLAFTSGDPSQANSISERFGLEVPKFRP